MAGALTAAIAAAFSGGGSPPVTTDEYFEYTTLLLPGNGTNGAQNNSFLDTGNPAEFTASITGTTMTVTAVASGTIKVGVRILGSGVSLNTTITAFVSGTNGGVGVYTVSTSQTVSSTTVTSDGFPITRNGTPMTQGTFSPFSQTGWGNYFDGVDGSNLSIVNSSSLDQSGDFTQEVWYCRTGDGFGTIDVVFIKNLTNFAYININQSTGIVYANQHNVGTLITGTTATVRGVWYHIALTRSSNSLKLFVNGVQEGSTITYSTNTTGSATSYIGGFPAAHATAGYLSNLRVTNTAVYTSNFTPPTSPLTAISGTSLLTCQSNRFIDNSTNNFTITRNGNTSVVAFSPFNPTASWSAATYGGSGYFDGSGDYLTAPDNAAFAFGSGAVTIETWAYFNTTISSFVTLLAQSDNASAAGSSFIFVIDTSGKVNFEFYYGSSTLTLVDPDTVPINQWVHLAAARNASNTISLYVNGNRKATNASFSASVNDSSQPVSLGGRTSGVQPLNGYLSNSRIVKGTAVYDPTQTSITVPTAPLTAITNTSLLLNFTNAGIYDATSKNDLETVGNAQISTAISAKWGSGSMYFDGAGDYLISNISTSDLYTFGTGAFTVEFWLYLNSTSGVQICIDFRPLATNGPQIILFTNAGVLTFQSSSTVRITGSTLSTGQWYHIALSRSGTDTKMFLNGTQTGSTYSGDTTSYNTGANRPAIGADGANLSLNNLNGYLQDVRITKGIARYTSNFTAPTAAFPTL